MNAKRRSILVMALAMTGLTPAMATLIYLDFGNTAYAGTEAGPAGTAASAVGWNTINLTGSDFTGSLLEIDGTTSTPILTGDSGRGTSAANFDVVDWSRTDPDPVTAGYNGPSVLDVVGLFEDGFDSGHSGSSRILGYRLQGLSGTFDVYATVMRSTAATSTTSTTSVQLGRDSAGTADEIGELDQATTRAWNSWDGSLTTWSDSAGSWNYIHTQVTVDSDDWIVALVGGESDNASGNYSVLSSLQIVAIPEPSSMLLVLGGGFLMLALRVSRINSVWRPGLTSD